jgi:hypothetical protein
MWRTDRVGKVKFQIEAEDMQRCRTGRGEGDRGGGEIE